MRSELIIPDHLMEEVIERTVLTGTRFNVEFERPLFYNQTEGSTVFPPESYNYVMYCGKYNLIYDIFVAWDGDSTKQIYLGHLNDAIINNPQTTQVP